MAYWLARAHDALGRGRDAEAAHARAAKIVATLPLAADAKLARAPRAG